MSETPLELEEMRPLQCANLDPAVAQDCTEDHEWTWTMTTIT